MTNLGKALPDIFTDMTTYYMKTDKALKTEILEPKLRKEAKRIKVTWGPYTLAPADVSIQKILIKV